MKDINVRFSNGKFKQKAVIILSGCVKKYPPLFGHNYDAIMELINANPHYVVKHTDDPNKPSFITNDGFVNRYGYLVTETNLEIPSTGSIEFPKGCFKKETWVSIDELKNYLK